MWVCAAARQCLNEKHQTDNETLYFFFFHSFCDELYNSKHETLCTTWRYLSRPDKSDHGARRLDTYPVKIKV